MLLEHMVVTAEDNGHMLLRTPTNRKTCLSEELIPKHHSSLVILTQIIRSDRGINPGPCWCGTRSDTERTVGLLRISHRGRPNRSLGSK